MTQHPSGPSAAVLEHLTGRNRGSFTWITADAADLWLDATGAARLATPGNAPSDGRLAARIRRANGAFDIDSAERGDLWVNRRKVVAARLRSGDMIEFGEDGPLSRFRVFDDSHSPNPSITEIMRDGLSYLRTSRRPWPGRILRGVDITCRRLCLDTTYLFRSGVIAVLVLLTVLVWLQWREDSRLREAVESGNLQVDTLAAALSETRSEAIRPGDLNALSAELRARLDVNAERLETLEEQRGAGTRIVGRATPAIAFLQGGYGLRDAATGRMLRQVTGPDGLPLMLPTGQPVLSLDGTGPVAEVQISGTGFLLAGTHAMVTNRHVARPWETRAGAQGAAGPLEPVMIRLIAYFPGLAEPIEVTELKIGAEADVALLAPRSGDWPVAGLPLADAAPVPGEQIIVMGYPTGLMSLLAQSGAAFVEQLQASGDTNFWSVARRLAGAGRIAPLSSGGIVGQITPSVVVYDAETTHGGSGGPVLNLRGEVVAVNTAIMPEFGGSNFGVPATLIKALAETLDAGG